MRTLIRPGILTLAVSLFLAAGVQGEAYTFTVDGLVGMGGSFDESDAGFGNFSWKLGFASSIEERTRFGVRIGGLDWGSSDRLGNLTDPSLLYLTLAGEYSEASFSFAGGFVEPGIYIGLGLYQLDGTRADGREETDEAIGLVLGLTGDIPVNRKRNVALRIELSGHYTDLSTAQIFALAELGVAYRF